MSLRSGICRVGLLCLVVPALAFAVEIRIDTNGELVNETANAGFTGPMPFGWNTYTTGGGGGMVGRWDTGGSSNTFSTQYADEEAERALLPSPQNTAKAGVYPGGHSVLLGGNTTTTAGTYGISQTYAATPGKFYWISGCEGASADWSSSQQAKYAFDYGVESGTGVTNGQISTGNIRRSGGTLLNGRFSQAVVATSNQVTSHVGMRTNGANTGDINAYIDGIRVYQIDAPFNSSLLNAGFEGSATDISAYNVKGVSGSGANAQNDLLASWIPLGGAAGQRCVYNQDSAVKNSGSYAFQFDMNKGNGRMYAAQRVDMGGAGLVYNLTGMVRADTGDSNAKIGIDPTGGLDPNAASVVWSSASAVNSAFNLLSVTATDLTGNGITVFLGAGTYGTAQSYRLGGDFGARFDDLVLTPEPATLALLAFGSAVLLRRRRH